MQLALLEQLEPPALPDLLVLREQRVKPVQLVRKALPVRKAQPARLDLKDLLVQLV